MADVSSTLRAWSSTASSNQPQGGTTIGSGLDDNLRQLQAVVRQFLADQSTTVVPSAGVADLSTATGRWVPVSGSSTVTGFGTESAGIWYLVTLTGSPTINNGNISTPGGVTIVASAGDMFVADSQGAGVWRIHSYTRASYEIPYPTGLAAAQASTSGTAIDFTGIPSWAKKIVVQFVGVSLSGTSNYLVQLGDSGGVESSGYNGSGGDIANGGTGSAATSNSGFLISSGSASAKHYGSLIITLENAASFSWVAQGVFGRSDANSIHWTAGAKATSAQTDRVRVTTVNGSDTFDAGEINVLYE